ncbi:replication protein A 70 kDa DNA-binding subunit B [Tanacetum coccineum]
MESFKFTKVEPCPDFSGSFYGFYFRRYRFIIDLQQEEEGQFDVIGHVIACEDLDMYDKNAKSGKKKPLTLVDHEGNELQCTLWSKMCVQNAYNATKLFLFDATQPIVDEEFQDVKEYSSRLFAREDVEKSENTATRISTASKNSTKETFVGKNPQRNIVELLDVAQVVTSVIVVTIIVIHEEEGWWLIIMTSFLLPTEITVLIGKKYAFKVFIDDYNLKKLLPVFTVLRLSDDPEILDSIRLAVTPIKMDTEATSA